MASSHKKVILRRLVGDVLAGYLPADHFVRQGSVGLLDLDGRLNFIPIPDIKHISYVRDFNLGDLSSPERLSRRTYLARPRGDGLWLRITFRAPAGTLQDPRSPDLLEGLASTGIALFDDLLSDAGVHLTPPDIRSNTQRIFVPHTSIADLQILAVITSPSRRKPVLSAAAPLQEDLFATLLPTGTVETES